MKNFFLVLTCYNENKVTSRYYVNYKEKSQNSGLGNVLFGHYDNMMQIE